MTNDYFVVNPGNDTSVFADAATTRHGGKPGAPHKISLTLANLPKRRDNAGATWPRTPSKIDPQVSHFWVQSPRVCTVAYVRYPVGVEPALAGVQRVP